MGKDAYYFSHDANARNDPKHIALRGKWGWQGYGWYWAIVEMMREEEDYIIPIEAPYQWAALAAVLDCDPEEARDFVDDCVDVYQLFERENGSLWSNSLLRRMERREEISKARAKAGQKGGKSKASVKQTQANAKQLPSKPKQDPSIKGKESKGKESIYPSLGDLPKDDSNRNVYPDRFDSFWNAYPRKTDKGGAYEKWRSLVVNEGADPDDLVAAAEHYAEECERNRTEERYVKLAPTFLAANKERWREYLEPPTAAIEDDYYKQLTPWEVPE